MDIEMCVRLCVWREEFGGLGINRTRLAGSCKHWIINYGGWCDAEVMVLVGEVEEECVWSEILITGVRRVTRQLIEAGVVWGGCDELPAVSLQWLNLVLLRSCRSQRAYWIGGICIHCGLISWVWLQVHHPSSVPSRSELIIHPWVRLVYAQGSV